MRRTVLVVLLVLGGLVAAGCSGSGEEGSSTTTTAPTTRSSAGSASTTTTTEQGTSTPAGPGPTQGFGTARSAIDHFVGAWQAGDKASAQTGATVESVRNVFTQPGAGFALYGCDTGEFSTSTCNYRDRATQGYASITAEKAPIGWIVTAVYMTIDN